MKPIRILLLLITSCALWAAASPADEPFDRARASAATAGYSLSKVHRWLHEAALPMIDEKTGLYIADGHWNYRDTAADCYPFLTWAAFVTDRQVLDGPVRDILHAEQNLCNFLDRIPVPYDCKNGRQIDPGYDEMVFQASEYVKDGLIAIVEATGKDEWFDRMMGIEEDLWKHARYETPGGKIPSTNLEVNGEQIQALVRLYTMTGEERFLHWAERLADYYLLAGDFVPPRLRDHGCEIIGGLGLLLGIESERNPEKAEVYRPLVKKMLDEVLARGVNADGIMFNTLDKPDSGLSDCWGYNYVTYLCFDMVAGRPVYRDRIAATLAKLAKPEYKNYRWEGSVDGIADSAEGAIYLLNRLPVAEGLAWVDRELADNVVQSAEPWETGPLWGTMKLQANAVRTTIIHALMHTRGLTAHPWQPGMKLGAAQTDEGLFVVLQAPADWSGRLVFDIPRHREYFNFQRDWPRMNTLPEWFTVEPERSYVVTDAEGAEQTFTGRQLHEGLPVELEAARELRLRVR